MDTIFIGGKHTARKSCAWNGSRWITTAFSGSTDSISIPTITLDCMTGAGGNCMDTISERRRGMSVGTGKFDKNGDEMLVGDIVHFRTSGLSGKGVVYLEEEPDRLGEDLFRIRDTRPGKQNGRIYPFYPKAIYRIDGHEEKKE